MSNSIDIVTHKVNPSVELLKLGSLPKTHKFSIEELRYIKKHHNSSRWVIHYVVYTQKTIHNKYIGLCVDYMGNNPRNRKPKHYSMEVICSRELNAKEKMWEYENYGCQNRRFKVYWEHYVESIIQMDAFYGIETPQKFVDHCKENGWSGGIQQTIQFF